MTKKWAGVFCCVKCVRGYNTMFIWLIEADAIVKGWEFGPEVKLITDKVIKYLHKSNTIKD